MRDAILLPSPNRAPQRINTASELRALQRIMLHAVIRPLAPGDRIARVARNGRPMSEVVGEFIKPSRSLNSVERLTIYARTYWRRLIDHLSRDFPALHATLGDTAFTQLTRAYLSTHPSRSPLLHPLGARLPSFIRRHPTLTKPSPKIGYDVARFEQAQKDAIDSRALIPLRPDEPLDRRSALRMRVRLQPYITLLRFDWPVDQYVAAASKNAGVSRSHIKNLMRRFNLSAITGARNIHLVVHRFEDRLYYKRLEPRAYRVLQSLSHGRTLAGAAQRAGTSPGSTLLYRWLAEWVALGWLCPKPLVRRPQSRARNVSVDR